MKLHEIARQARALGIAMGENSSNRERQEKLLEMLHFNSGNFYQEIEMDDPLVQTQEDISTTEDVVGLHNHVYYEIIFIRSGNPPLPDTARGYIAYRAWGQPSAVVS